MCFETTEQVRTSNVFLWYNFFTCLSYFGFKELDFYLLVVDGPSVVVTVTNQNITKKRELFIENGNKESKETASKKSKQFFKTIHHQPIIILFS